MSTAILFNGAASYIAQEAGILDLLLGNVEGVPGVGLNIQDLQFVGGLSSGALMSLAFNAAFCDPPKLSWDEFKQNTLFTMTTEKVYTGAETPFNTSPLRKLVQDITEQVGYNLIKDLPFESAILTTNVNLIASTFKTYWLTNIAKVAEVLPSQTDKLVIAKNIKEHQLELELVSSLMCSTAIPGTFPPQKLYYKDNSNSSVAIKNNVGIAANFVDGGLGDQEVGEKLVFADYQEFFEAYGEKFDKIYFISPNFAKTEAEALQRISLAKRSGAIEEEAEPIVEPILIMENWTKEFLKSIKAYNSGGSLANTIYYCKPEVEGFNPLDFSKEKEQYDATIAWGKNNPNNIAIDINSITL
jgi:predicted acylesterase/phospholipase RssA